MMTRDHDKLLCAWHALCLWRRYAEGQRRSYSLLTWLRRPGRYPNVNDIRDLTPAQARRARRQLNGWRWSIAPRRAA